MLVKSNPFVESLLKMNISQNEIPVALKDYLVGTNKEGFVSKIKSYLLPKKNNSKGSNSFDYKNVEVKRLSTKDEILYNMVKEELISLDIDEKNGFVTLSVALGNPEVAAIVAHKAQKLLQQEIINFKITNAQEQLTFIEGLYEEKKSKFEALQDELATYKDQNLNISSEIFGNILSRLQTEVAIASTVYEEVAKQVEQARIQVIKETPIFTIIEPVIIPNMRTSPKRKLIVILCLFIGLAASLVFVLFKDPFRELCDQILNERD